MFKRVREILKKIFIYVFIFLLLIASPVSQDTVLYKNAIVNTSINSLEIVKQNQFLLSHNIVFEELNVNIVNQISTLQQQGYGFIQIIFMLVLWIIRIVIFIIKMIIRAIIVIFSYVVRILPTLSRIIINVIKVSFRFIVNITKSSFRFIITWVRKIPLLLKNMIRIFGKIIKKLFFYVRKGFIGIKKLFTKLFSNLKKSTRKISTSKKVVAGGGLGTVTTKQVLANTKSVPTTSKNINTKQVLTTKVKSTHVNPKNMTTTTKQALANTNSKSIPVASKNITKSSTAKIKSIRPGKQKTNLKYNRSLSPNIRKYMASPAERKVYEKLNLKETKINGRRILRRENIYDIYQKDLEGRTNLERMKKGLSPVDENNKPIELHHIGQKMDSPLAELRYDEHKKYFGDIHNNFEKSEIDRNIFAKEKREYWKTLAKIYEENSGN